MERAELQVVIGKAVSETLVANGVVLDGDHTIKLVRVLVRAAARLLLDKGAGLGDVMGAFAAFYAHEAVTEKPSRVTGAQAEQVAELN